MGWPGSVQDTKVFRHSAIFQDRKKHFNWDEYILCDKGYPLTKFTIRPFAEYDLTNDPAEAASRREWNMDLSHIRIAVEHAFGRLKGRFPILRNFPGQDLSQIFKTIQACMVLHNILTELQDDPSEIEDYEEEDEELEDEDIPEGNQQGGQIGRVAEDLDNMDDNTLYRTGLIRRKHLLEFKYTQM